jgi:hypothetical protein
MPAKPNKTQSTEVPVDAFLAGVTPEGRRKDALSLREMMQRLSGEPARMWGPSIVGFGASRYSTPAGREGEILKLGFAPRKAALVLYVSGWTEGDELLGRLGKVSHGKGCLYVKRLADIDVSVLEAMIRRGVGG